ncbi:hypothetical protein RUW49_26170, partial [Citrobacter freundii]|uniref:hypothetical protein n=1 Tax=Citrobacter freundii TaxID=546 RepID=UPI0028FADE3F
MALGVVTVATAEPHHLVLCSFALLVKVLEWGQQKLHRLMKGLLNHPRRHQGQVSSSPEMDHFPHGQLLLLLAWATILQTQLFHHWPDMDWVVMESHRMLPSLPEMAIP